MKKPNTTLCERPQTRQAVSANSGETRKLAGDGKASTKPFRDQDLLDAIETVLARDRARRESEEALASLRERFDTLSSREREIMIKATAGRLNKQIANDVGLADDSEGASEQPDAKDEGPVTSGTQSNGGHAQADVRKAAPLLIGRFCKLP